MNTGTNTSINKHSAEVTNISPFGIWLLVDGKEYFLGYDEYPFFQKASIRSIAIVESDCMGNLHWPELDEDLEIDSLDNPDSYPLIYQK